MDFREVFNMIIQTNKNANVKLSEINIFACAPCMGKTTLENIDNRFVDMDKMKSMYKYDLPYENHEETKGIANKTVVNLDSFEYIKEKTFELLSQKKKLLFTPKPENTQFLTENKLPYCLVFFHPDRLPELIKKMKDRGNPEEFIKMFTYETQLEYFNNHNTDERPTFKVELQAGEHIADIFNLF